MDQRLVDLDLRLVEVILGGADEAVQVGCLDNVGVDEDKVAYAEMGEFEGDEGAEPTQADDYDCRCFKGRLRFAPEERKLARVPIRDQKGRFPSPSSARVGNSYDSQGASSRTPRIDTRRTGRMLDESRS